MLSAGDVEQKTFSTALRGYDLDEVDDFLDEVVGTIRQLTDQIEEARKGAPATGTPEAPVASPEPLQAIDESAIGRALVAAQNTADQLVAEAREQADRILAEAREEAERVLAGAQDEAETWQVEREARRAEAEEEMASMSARIAAIRSELAVLAGEVADRLDQMDSAVMAAAPSDAESAGQTSLEMGEGPSDDGVTGEGEDDFESPFDPEEISIESTEGDASEDTPADDFGQDVDRGDDQGGGGSHHLDEILTGVATDLRLGGEEEEREETEDEQ